MKKKFPVPANCSRCGHHGELYIEDEQLYKAMEHYRRSRTNLVWAALVVPRMIVSWLVASVLGFALGVIL